MLMDYPLLGAAPGSTYGRMLLDIKRNRLKAYLIFSVPVLCQDIIIQIKLPLLVMTTIVRVDFMLTIQKSPRIAWEDPLWDGEGCTQPNNTCCQRSGWFHKEVPPTTDNIEVRWCCDESRANEDVLH